jgi:threonine aldolase
MPFINRRNFLRSSGIAAIPAILPLESLLSAPVSPPALPPGNRVMKFFGDGEMFEPADYLDILQKAHSATAIVKDRYGVGGVIEELEKKFQLITGKEKAIFLPSGTMANQFAIAALSGSRSKVFVQETSHVFRDEADAAQTIFQKRLFPLAAGKTFFTAADLKAAIEALPAEEAFSTGIGAVSIENPVRRSDGRMIPIDEIRKISTYCRNNNIKLHLDGARIYMASTWSGITVKEYASYFDTVYVSLYKYLGAGAGAILCGDTATITTLPHLLKVHGGSMYGNWTNAAMALHRLEGLEERLQESLSRSAQVFKEINKIPGMAIKALDGGTNIYQLILSKEIDGKKFQVGLNKNYNIRVGAANKENIILLTVNETLLYQDAAYVVNAFKNSIK